MRKKNTNQIFQVTATTTVTRLFGERANRKAFLIYNNGSVIVEVLDNGKQAYGVGMPLKPASTIDDDHFNPQGELWIVAASATCDLRIWEILSTEEG